LPDGFSLGLHPQNRRKWLLRGLKLLIIVLVVWAVRRTLYDGLSRLDEHPWHVQPAWLAAAGAIYLAGLFPAAVFWHRALGALGQDVRLAETLRAYYIGHLGKYVPGKAMVVVLRVGLVGGRRVDTALAAVSVFLETLTMMSVGATIAAAILAVWFRQQTFLMLVALGLAAAAGLPTLPPVFRRLVRLARVGAKDPVTAARLEKVGYATLLSGWALMGLCWALLGLSLWAVLRGMGVSDLGPVRELPLQTASVSLAMVAGFLSLIPGGAVVREAVLAELIAPRFGDVVAVVSAVLLRLVWLLSELGISGILYVTGATTRARDG
jgi:uncharacterized membrane protein YbhN (UPF0104 family)